jgi:sugar lactone lactonase YvrE
MLVSGLHEARIWRVSDGALGTYADLTGLSPFDWGDIVIDSQDRIYIANQGMSYPHNMPEPIDSRIYLVVANEPPRMVAADFLYANGLAITPDGRHLVVAESFGHRLWRMPIREDGSLGARELIVQLPVNHRPDGICCDAQGAVWSANATGREVIRCTQEGVITDRISTGEDLAIGCILGGSDGCDLYVTTAPTADRIRALELRSSALWRVRVEVPAGGRP